MAKNDTENDHADAFWDFSVEVYGREGVEAACLALQDRHGIDVNMLLFCCWAGASGYGTLDEDDFSRALAVSRPWQQEIVAPLRQVRARLKAALPTAPKKTAEAVRQRVAAAEIDAERVEQLMIAAMLTRSPGAEQASASGLADAIVNLERYLSVAADLEEFGDAADHADLVALLAGTFPTLSRDEIEPRLAATLCGDC